jgi:hypothetical protein
VRELFRDCGSSIAANTICGDKNHDR